jgi:imidazolonepropionase-like amidohydrolase
MKFINELNARFFKKFTAIVFAFCTTALGNFVVAHDQIPGGPQVKPIAIVGGTVHPISGDAIEGGIVVFDKGVITAIGKDVEIPEGAQRIEAEGLHVYPGMIDSMTDLGLREIGAVDVTIDSRETGSMNANVRSWTAVNPDSELIPVARANGILSAMIVPGGFGIQGQGAVMALDGWTAADMIIRAPAGLCVYWDAYEPRDSDEKKRASDREKRLEELDTLLDQAQRYADARAADPDHTPTNLRLEALLPVLAGEMPIIASANRKRSIESAVMYAASKGLKLVIAGGYDAELCAELLKKYDVPVIITATYRLPQYRHDAYDASYTLPKRLSDAGVRFTICGDANDASFVRNLPYHAANAVAYGLDENEAVRALTLSAAEILGVDEKIGSLDAGKLATLVVTDGHLLESDTQVLKAFIAGRVVDLGSRHTQLYEKYKVKYQQRAVEKRLSEKALAN